MITYVCNILGIPSWDILVNKNNNVHKIIIFEDCATNLNAANQTEVKNFLFQSRHKNFSLILVTHNTNHANARKDSFERCFLQNCNAYAFALGHFADTRLIQTFMRDCADFQFKETKEIIKMAQKTMKYPVIYVSNKHFKDVHESKVRFDLFKSNTMLFRKFN